MVTKKIIDDYQAQLDRNEIQEDSNFENDYINNNLQLIEKEIEPHSKNFFQIINRDLQQGNIHQGGMMYMTTLESYHRSLTYTKELKQKLPTDYIDEFEVIDPKVDIDIIDWKNHEEVKNIPKIKIRKTVEFKPVTIKRLYRDVEKNKIIEKTETIKEIYFLKEHILDSPLERGSHFIVVSNSVEGFLRKNRRTISREVNAKTTDSIEAGKPIIMKQNGRNDYFNGGGSW